MSATSPAASAARFSPNLDPTQLEPVPPKPEVTGADRAEAMTLPLTHRFTLGATSTPVQQAFVDMHGFVVFAQVATQDEVDTILAEVDKIEELGFARIAKRSMASPSSWDAASTTRTSSSALRSRHALVSASANSCVTSGSSPRGA